MRGEGPRPYLRTPTRDGRGPPFSPEIVLDLDVYGRIRFPPMRKAAEETEDAPMVVYPVRLEEGSLAYIRESARRKDRTRQSLIREAVREWIQRDQESA